MNSEQRSFQSAYSATDPILESLFSEYGEDYGELKNRVKSRLIDRANRRFTSDLVNQMVFAGKMTEFAKEERIAKLNDELENVFSVSNRAYRWAQLDQENLLVKPPSILTIAQIFAGKGVSSRALSAIKPGLEVAQECVTHIVGWLKRDVIGEPSQAPSMIDLDITWSVSRSTRWRHVSSSGSRAQKLSEADGCCRRIYIQTGTRIKRGFGELESIYLEWVEPYVMFMYLVTDYNWKF